MRQVANGSSRAPLAQQTKEGYDNVSDYGVDKALRAFFLIRNSEGDLLRYVSAGHGRFNCRSRNPKFTCTYVRKFNYYYLLTNK